MMAARTVHLKAMVNMPRKVHVGRTCVMAVDLKHDSPWKMWPYSQEEFIVLCQVIAWPLFESTPLEDATLVVHRFGGTYGEIHFLLRASQQPMKGDIIVRLLNIDGMPIEDISLCGVDVVSRLDGAENDCTALRSSGSDGGKTVCEAFIEDISSSLSFKSASLAGKHERAKHELRSGLYRSLAALRQRFEEGEIVPLELAKETSDLADAFLRVVCQINNEFLLPRLEGISPIAVVAMGEYGKGLVPPLLDMNVLILSVSRDTREDEWIQSLIVLIKECGCESVLMVETIDSYITAIESNWLLCLDALSARLVWGSEHVFYTFQGRLRDEVVVGSKASFVERSLIERDSRHEQMGISRFILEPHVKDSRGGLCDLQTLFCIAEFLYQANDVAQLVDRGVFTAKDIRQLRRAESFLWGVRCHLHYVVGKSEEWLTFNLQEVVARRLGYNDRASGRGVERFMKHYYRVTKSVGDLTRVLCGVLEDEHKIHRLRFRLIALSRTLFRRLPSGLRIDGDRLGVDSSSAFDKNPVLLLRLFHEAQRQGIDIHPHALRQVHQSLRLIDASLRSNAEANRLFMDILTDEKDAELTLKRLADSGVLGRFIPDFGRVISQMQFDLYNVYTVDEHTIRAIGMLNKIERGELKDEHPAATVAFSEIRSRRALYLAVLLHDIAKGRGGDHSEIGAEIALNLAPRLGLDEWETETVSWLVRFHLLMRSTSSKRDIDDWKTVIDFVDRVQSPERLRMLLILTNADIHAVGPNIWNAWTCSLLDELYYRALEDMEMAARPSPERWTMRVERAKAKLRARLKDWPEDVCDRLISLGYSDYWLVFGTEDHVRHFALIRDAEETGRDLLVEIRQRPSLDITEITIYAPDHLQLFSQIVGAMELSDAFIVGAKAVTFANSMALKVFWFQEIAAKSYSDEDRVKRLVRRIENAIVGKTQPAQDLKEVRDATSQGTTGVFKVPPRIIFDNKASDKSTVIEVQGRLRCGFLHDITAILPTFGLQIASAHVSRYGERIISVFYVRDIFGLKIEQVHKLQKIESALFETFSGLVHTSKLKAN